MGHTHSKRNQERKRKEEIADLIVESINHRDSEPLRQYSSRLSTDLDRMSLNSACYSRDTLSAHDTRHSTASMNRSMAGISHGPILDGSFSYENLNVDDHPALTKLQNEQNARLEHMEARITKIRTNAIKAAEQRKFAEMFKAKRDEEKTVQLLKKATDALVLDLAKHNPSALKCSSTGDSDDDKDKGEIIPVKILSEAKQSSEKPMLLQALNPLGSMKFSDPVMVVLLPFLVPILIIVFIIRCLSQPLTIGWQDADTDTRRKKTTD